MTPVLYFLFVGCILANTGVLPEESGAFIRNFAELGIILIMLALGFEESTDNFMARFASLYFGKQTPHALGSTSIDAGPPVGATMLVVGPATGMSLRAK